MPETDKSKQAKSNVTKIITKYLGVISYPNSRSKSWLVSQDKTTSVFLTFSKLDSKNEGFFDIAHEDILKWSRYEKSFIVFILNSDKNIFITPISELEKNLIEENRNSVDKGKYKLHLIDPQNNPQFRELPRLSLRHYLNNFECFEHTNLFISQELLLGHEELDRQKFFDYPNEDEAKNRIYLSIARRQGQAKFRQILLQAYDFKCAISDCDAEVALEADHIIPYIQTGNNHPSNGLLLRADLHTIFDLNLIAISPKEMKIFIHPELQKTKYQQLQGRKLRTPSDQKLRPSNQYLYERLKYCNWFIE